MPKIEFPKTETGDAVTSIPARSVASLKPLLAMMLPAPGAVPPMVTLAIVALTPDPPLPIACSPVTSVPMSLPSIVSVWAVAKVSIPLPPLFEMTFPAPGVVPPIRTLTGLQTYTPALALPIGWVPVTSVPM